MEDGTMQKFARKTGRMVTLEGAAGLLLTRVPSGGEVAVSLPSDLELVAARKTTSTSTLTSPTKTVSGKKATSPTSTTSTTAPAPVEPLPATLSSWTSEGVHPQAAAQPTARGRRIVDLQAFGGKVYAGYG